MPNYPYTSGQGAIVATFAQLRKAVPAKVDASYLQRFNIAPANESYVISILRFLGLIGEDGDRIEDNTSFLYGNDEAFKEGLEARLRESYSALFDDMGDSALDAKREELIHWFRASDKTSELVGGRQASTYQTLAALAGHGELPARPPAAKKTAAVPRSTSTRPAQKRNGEKTEAAPQQSTPRKTSNLSTDRPAASRGLEDIALTVRIEVNLPSGGDATTYDAIFASIKKHLMS